MLAKDVLRIELPERSLVIGDLHIDVDAGSDSTAFSELADFLISSKDAPVLLILGDLFEYWLGRSHASSPGGKACLGLLASFKGQVILIPGNRDVLAGAELEAAGIKLAKDGLCATLPGGQEALFLHGDELCIRDLSYQRQRRILRHPILRSVARYLPIFVVRAIAHRLRNHSKKVTPTKAPLEVAQDLDEAARRLDKVGAQTLVVGHAHRYREEQLATSGRLIVLDAFGGQRDLVRIATKGELEIGSSQVRGRDSQDSKS